MKYEYEKEMVKEHNKNYGACKLRLPVVNDGIQHIGI